MNKLSKILIAIIIVLVIILAIVTFKYFEMRNIAKKNFDDFMNATTELHDLQYGNKVGE